MNPEPDDQKWLRRIGVATADTETTDSPGPAPHRDAQDFDFDDPPTDPIALADIIDLDADLQNPDTTAENPQPPTRKRFTPWVAAVFAAVAVTATATTAAAAALTSKDNAPAPPTHPSMSARPPAPAPPQATPENADAPIPFTASADCPPGSTAAESVSDPQAKTPWICARTVDGQVLHIDLGRVSVITAVSIVPGAVTGDAAQTDPTGQSDPWLQHRVVTRIQWQFNDADKTVRTQNTGNVRGEAVLPVPNVLASAITAIIQQTSRPPATAATITPTQNPQDGVLGPLLGSTATETPTGPMPTDTPDPSDGTFAVTTIKVIGHKAT
jgi:hypothetical protein